MARCVVLGGGGFIGANLARRLQSDGHQVMVIDKDWPEWRRPIGDYWTCDLTRIAETQHAIQNAEWVFHLAADMGGVGYFHSDADWGAAITNGLITNNVLRALQPEQRLFYAASVCAYPVELMMPGVAPLRESQLGMGTPDALYGAEKLHGIRLCSKMPNARVGLFDTIYGPLQEHEGRRMKFPAAVATKALRARGTGELELWGNGSQVRCYLYIDDAVDRIIQVMSADHYDGPVNIAASTPASCWQVARMCLELVGCPDAKITTNEAEPTGAQYRVIDSTNYRLRYGDTHETPLREGFAKFMRWLEER